MLFYLAGGGGLKNSEHKTIEPINGVHFFTVIFYSTVYTSLNVLNSF